MTAKCYVILLAAPYKCSTSFRETLFKLGHHIHQKPYEHDFNIIRSH